MTVLSLAASKTGVFDMTSLNVQSPTSLAYEDNTNIPGGLPQIVFPSMDYTGTQSAQKKNTPCGVFFS